MSFLNSNVGSVPSSATRTDVLSDGLPLVKDLLAAPLTDDNPSPSTGSAQPAPATKAGANSQPAPRAVPRGLGRTAPQRPDGAAASLAGTRPAGIPIKVRLTTGAFANPAGSGVSGTVDITAKVDPETTATLQLKNTYADPLGKGAPTDQTRMRFSVNRTVFQDASDKLVVGGRLTASFTSNLGDGSSRVAYGGGGTFAYTHKLNDRVSAGVGGSLDFTAIDPSRGPSTSNWRAEGEGRVDYALDKDGADVLTAVVTGYKQVNSDGSDSDAMALGFKYAHKFGDRAGINFSVYDTIEGSRGGVDESYSPLGGGITAKVEAWFQF
jgi:hypothetical protein